MEFEEPIILFASPNPSTLRSQRAYLECVCKSISGSHSISVHQMQSNQDLIRHLLSKPISETINMLLLIDVSEGARNVWSVGEHSGIGLAAEIALSFPEIYTVSMHSPHPGAGSENRLSPKVNEMHSVRFAELSRLTSLIRLHADGFRTLFDASGLRAELKKQVTDMHFSDESTQHRSAYKKIMASRQESIAAVIDDEPEFAMCNGFRAYSAGYRVWPVTSSGSYRFAVTQSETDAFISPPDKYDVLVTDWDLAFTDDVPGESVQAGGGADPSKADPGASDVGSLLQREPPHPKRFNHATIVTSNPMTIDPDLLGGETVVVNKPIRGIYRLLSADPGGDSKRTSLGDNHDHVRRTESSSGKTPRKARTAGSTPQSASNKQSRHAVPHATAITARRLIRRARSIKQSNPDFVQSIAATAFAMEAKEILGGRARTQSVEAVVLSVEFELRAHISFFGVADVLDAGPRLDEACDEIDSLFSIEGSQASGNTGIDQDKVLELRIACEDTKSQMLVQLRNVLREANQMDAVLRSLRLYGKSRNNLNWLNAKSHLRRGLKQHGEAWRLVRQRGTKETSTLMRLGCALLQTGFLLWRLIFTLARPLWEWYIDRSTATGTSALRVLAVGALWFVIFGVIYGFIFLFGDTTVSGLCLSSFGSGFKHSLFTFLQMDMMQVSPAKSIVDTDSQHILSWILLTVGSLEIVVSFVQLGLLISMLYQKVTRISP